MFADPLPVKKLATNTVTAVGTAGRTGSTQSTAAYRDSANGLTVTVRHNPRKGRAVHSFKVTEDRVVTDPIYSDRSLPVSQSAWIAIDVPSVGFTPTEQLELAQALIGTLVDQTNKVLVQLLNGES